MKSWRIMIKNLSPSVKLAGIYLLFSVVWILGTDWLVESIAGSNLHLLSQLQGIKGIVFVLVSALLLYVTAARLYGNLNASIHKYKALSEASREAIGEVDLATNAGVVNEKMRELLGAGSTSIRNFSQMFLELVHPHDREKLKVEFLQACHSDEDMVQLDFRIRWTDGQYHTVQSHCYFIREAGTGKATGAIGALSDMSQIIELQNRYQNQKIQHKKTLAMSVIKAQELERDRWAKELHDNVCQQLTAAKLFLGEFSAEKPVQDELLSIVKSSVSSAITDIREMSASLRPPELGNITLMEAIQNLAGNLQRARKFDIHIESGPIQEVEFSEEHKLMIYRIVQEQLNNIIKYASPNQVRIRISSREGQALISIEDDGLGFDTQQIRTGIGLKNIQSRLHLFKGRMELNSAPGQGCRLSAVFPI